MRLLRSTIAAAVCACAVSIAASANADTYMVTRVESLIPYGTDMVVVDLIEAIPGPQVCTGAQNRLAFHVDSEAKKAMFAMLLTAHASDRWISLWISDVSAECLAPWGARAINLFLLQ
jgi:hypothetical protein